MATQNKFAKYAMGNAAGAIILTFLFGLLGTIFAFIALALGIKGYLDYKKDNAIGGSAGAISAIVISIILIIIMAIRLVMSFQSLRYGFP